MILLLNHDTVVYRYNTETKQIDILSDNLRSRLKEGVAIPEKRLQDFGGRKIVPLSDAEQFHRAFSEIFYTDLDHTVFRWEIRAISK